MTSSEGCWRIFPYDTHGRDPCIQRLAVHEENLHMVTFNEDNPQEAVANPKNTTLLAWFKLNQYDPDARHLKYHEIPKHYVWNSHQHKWTKTSQKRGIGHMYTASLSQGERHYLRILLHHVAGATSFTHLKTSQAGITYNTFKETALALGPLESDEEWDECLSEAAVSFMPVQIHSFVTILTFGEPAKPATLWEKYKEVMGEDVLREISASPYMSVPDLQKCADNEVLLMLQEELEGMGACLEQYGLPTPNIQE